VRGIVAHVKDTVPAPFLYQEGWSFFVIFLLKTVKLKGVTKVHAVLCHLPSVTGGVELFCSFLLKTVKLRGVPKLQTRRFDVVVIS